MTETAMGIVNSQTTKVSFKRKPLKHIAEKPDAFPREIVERIPFILKNHKEIRLSDKTGENGEPRYMFAWYNGDPQIVVVEVQREETENIITTVFKSEDKKYLEKFELLWRTDAIPEGKVVPPSASAREEPAGSRSEFSALKTTQISKGVNDFFRIQRRALEAGGTPYRTNDDILLLVPPADRERLAARGLSALQPQEIISKRILPKPEEPINQIKKRVFVFGRTALPPFATSALEEQLQAGRAVIELSRVKDDSISILPKPKAAVKPAGEIIQLATKPEGGERVPDVGDGFGALSINARVEALVREKNNAPLFLSADGKNVV